MMDDLTMWTLLVGFFLPPLMAVLQQPKWSDAVRSTVAFVVCTVVGGITAWLNGDVTGKTVVSAILIVLVTALSTYKSFWKQIKVTTAIENATSSTDFED